MRISIAFTMIVAMILVGLATTSARATIIAGNLTIVNEEFLVPPYVGVTAPSTASPASAWLTGQTVFGTGLTGTWGAGTGNQLVVDSDSTLSIPGRSSPVGSVQSTFNSTGQLSTTASLNSTVQSQLASVNELWISYLVRGPTATDTQEVKLNTASSSISFGPRLAGYISRVGTDVDFTTTGFSANTTYLMIGQLLIDRAAGQNEVLKVWSTTNATTFNPLSAPLLTSSDNILEGPGSTFVSISIFKDANGFIFDSIQVEAAIPEPSTFLLALPGLAGLGLFAWRKRFSGCCS